MEPRGRRAKQARRDLPGPKAIVTFIVTNAQMAATDLVVVQHDSGGTLGAYGLVANTPAAGSFKISVRNNSAGSLSEALLIRFAIIKSVNA